VYCLGSFHQKHDECFLPFTPTKNIGKTLNPLILPFKFESTFCTLDLDIVFPSVTKSNIQMINTCPNEAGMMNTIFKNNKKP
jgi:hypothetical protein